MKPQPKTQLTQKLKLVKLGRRVLLGGNTCVFLEAEATCDLQKRNSWKHEAESKSRKKWTWQKKKVMAKGRLGNANKETPLFSLSWKSGLCSL